MARSEAHTRWGAGDFDVATVTGYGHGSKDSLFEP